MPRRSFLLDAEAMLNRRKESALNQVLRQFDLVRVIFQRFGALQSDLAGLFGGGFVQALAAEEIFSFGCAPRNWRHAAHDDARVAHQAGAAFDDRIDRNDGMIPSQPFTHFMMEAFAAGLWHGHEDFRDDLTK